VVLSGKFRGYRHSQRLQQCPVNGALNFTVRDPSSNCGELQTSAIHRSPVNPAPTRRYPLRLRSPGNHLHHTAGALAASMSDAKLGTTAPGCRSHLIWVRTTRIDWFPKLLQGEPVLGRRATARATARAGRWWWCRRRRSCTTSTPR
jgi:hypothetical protein